MKTNFALVAICLFGFLVPATPQNSVGVAQSPLVIGRETYFDFGPPFHYLELTHVQNDGAGSIVRRVLLTPEAGCFQPATAEFKSSRLNESVQQLLGEVDPCKISLKQIKKELKRRKKELVFSGMNVSMQFLCEGRSRILSSAVLDHDLFADKPNTPKVTSWTMNLLSKLDEVLGRGAMDKPMFQTESASTLKLETPDPDFAREVENGAYDGLFPGATDHISAIYQASKKIPPATSATLTRITPSDPDSLIAPNYPPIAKAARVEGEVSFRFKIGTACAPDQVEITVGPKLLQQATIDAVKRWRFCKLPAGQEVQATIEFRLNCPHTVNTSVSQK